MKTKRFLALLLTIIMIGGMLPTAFAADAEATAKEAVYSFTVGAVKGATGTSVKTETITDKSMLDSTVSTGAWQYYTKPGIQYESLYEGGLQYYAFTEAEGKNAMVLRMWVDNSATYIPTLSYQRQTYCGVVDAYLVSAESVTKNGWTMSDINGINTAIAAKEAKHIVSVNTHGSSLKTSCTGDKVDLAAGEYYLVFQNSSPAGVTYSDSRMYGYIESLMLTPYVPEWSPVYAFHSEALLSKTGADINTVTSDTLLDRTVSTGAWAYVSEKNSAASYMYSNGEKTDALTLKSSAANIDNNAVMLKAKLDESGIYTPSLTYGMHSDRGTINIYLVPVKYAQSKGWTMDANLDLATVFKDSGVKHIISQDTYTTAGKTKGHYSTYADVELSGGEYYVLLSIGNDSGASLSNYFAMMENFTLNHRASFGIEADKTEIFAGRTTKVAAKAVSAGADVTDSTEITYESSDDSVAKVAADGTVTGVSAGTATVTVSATIGGADFSEKVSVTVSNDAEYIFTSEITGGERAIANIKESSIDTTASNAWSYVGKSNIGTGALDDAGLQFRVNSSDLFGNAAYVLKASVKNPGIYNPTVGWTAKPFCSIVDTYIVPVAYADAKWNMASPAASDIIADPGVTRIASVDMSQGEYKTGNPIKLSEDEYYILVGISALGNGNDSQGRAYGYIKSLTLDYEGELYEAVENPYIALATSTSIDPNTINVVGSDYTRGTEVTVTAPDKSADGYTFRHWVRGTAENGDWVSSDPSYTFTLATNTFLTAVYTETAAEDAKIVEFFNGNGEYITEKTVVDGKVTLPADPKMTGFKFLRW
ncbi:MAG: Ig-like domain-containing protein, partial [Oscillospiraceae bacterium]|nr:Ig-like domain-containing protein [Oscillospiraceae bacterium]